MLTYANLFVTLITYTNFLTLKCLFISQSLSLSVKRKQWTKVITQEQNHFIPGQMQLTGIFPFWKGFTLKSIQLSYQCVFSTALCRRQNKPLTPMEEKLRSGNSMMLLTHCWCLTPKSHFPSFFRITSSPKCSKPEEARYKGK